MSFKRVFKTFYSKNHTAALNTFLPHMYTTCLSAKTDGIYVEWQCSRTAKSKLTKNKINILLNELDNCFGNFVK